MAWQKFVLEYIYAHKQVTSNLNVDKYRGQQNYLMKLKMLMLSSKFTVSYSPDQSIQKLTKPIELSILHIVLSLPGIYVSA